MTDDTAFIHESISPGKIFRLLSEGFRRDLVTRALEHRAAATKHVREQLDDGIRLLRLDGFRDASRAQNHMLRRPILDNLGIHDQLDHAVLDCWVESREELHAMVAAYLAGRGIAVPESPGESFESWWSFDEWRREREVMAAHDSALDSEAAGLMLCLVSRRFPEPPPLQSPLLRGWIDELRDLPPEAPEWRETEVFAKWALDIRRRKGLEFFEWGKDEIARLCKDLRQRFDEDLRYLAVDPDPWPNEVGSRPALVDPTLAFVDALQNRLKEYQPLRPQATSRDEELQRSRERQVCEKQILYEVAEFQKRLEARPDPTHAPAPEAGASAEKRTADNPADTLDEDGQAAFNSLKSEFEQARQELEQAQQEIASLSDEKNRPGEWSPALQAEKARYDQEIDKLRQENKKLEDELSRSRRQGEQWRKSWVDEKQQRSRAGENDDSGMVDSVRTAIARAGEMFPKQMLIKLNSKSNQDTPFKHPRQVLDALAWLATAYRNVPSEQIKEDLPGWTYKPNQSGKTKGQYSEWYQTRVEGKAWDLSSHICKGKSRDPKHTIRIAFARDEEKERVIVGYIGLHQRNLQS